MCVESSYPSLNQLEMFQEASEKIDNFNNNNNLIGQRSCWLEPEVEPCRMKMPRMFHIILNNLSLQTTTNGVRYADLATKRKKLACLRGRGGRKGFK